jgi:chromosome segregation ATPase
LREIDYLKDIVDKDTVIKIKSNELHEVHEAPKKLATLQTKFVALKEENNQTKNALKEAEISIVTLQKGNKTLLEDIQVKEAFVKSLNEMLAEQSQSIGALNSELGNAKSKIVRLEVIRVIN